MLLQISLSFLYLSENRGSQLYCFLSQGIADNLVSIQDADGAWLINEPAYTSFDQTAEIALWLREISAELSDV